MLKEHYVEFVNSEEVLSFNFTDYYGSMTISREIGAIDAGHFVLSVEEANKLRSFLNEVFEGG